MESESYEEEVQPYLKTDYKPMMMMIMHVFELRAHPFEEFSLF